MSPELAEALRTASYETKQNQSKIVREGLFNYLYSLDNQKVNSLLDAAATVEEDTDENV